VRGTSSDDTLSGTPHADRIFGYAGNDVLVGGQDDDHLDGGPGQDRLKGGLGDDTIFGGVPRQTVTETTPHGRHEYIFGNGGDDVIVVRGAGAVIWAGRGNDRVDLRDPHDHCRLAFAAGAGDASFTRSLVADRPERMLDPPHCVDLLNTGPGVNTVRADDGQLRQYRLFRALRPGRHRPVRPRLGVQGRQARPPLTGYPRDLRRTVETSAHFRAKGHLGADTVRR
jgi:hypothetical protein